MQQKKIDRPGREGSYENFHARYQNINAHRVLDDRELMGWLETTYIQYINLNMIFSAQL